MNKRKQVFDKTDGRCAYCGEPLEYVDHWHIEHMIPKSRGGSDNFDNLLPACRSCNISKGVMTSSEFLEYQRQRLRVLTEPVIFAVVNSPHISRVSRLNLEHCLSSLIEEIDEAALRFDHTWRDDPTAK